jgi:hypothetical protein
VYIVSSPTLGANSEALRDVPASVGQLCEDGAGLVLAPGTGPGAGRIDFPFGVTPEVFLLE